MVRINKIYNEELDLLNLFHIFRSNRLFIISISLISLICAILYISIIKNNFKITLDFRNEQMNIKIYKQEIDNRYKYFFLNKYLTNALKNSYKSSDILIENFYLDKFIEISQNKKNMISFLEKSDYVKKNVKKNFFKKDENILEIYQFKFLNNFSVQITSGRIDESIEFLKSYINYVNLKTKKELNYELMKILDSTKYFDQISNEFNVNKFVTAQNQLKDFFQNQNNFEFLTSDSLTKVSVKKASSKILILVKSQIIALMLSFIYLIFISRSKFKKKVKNNAKF